MATKPMMTDDELEQGAPESPEHEAAEAPALEAGEDAAAAAGQPEPEEGAGPAGDDPMQLADDMPEIRAIEEQLLAKVPPQLRGAVERLVVAGMKLMFSPQMRQAVMAQLQGGATPEKVAQGIAGLISVLQGQAKGQVPQPALIPAAVILACQALDFLGKGGQMQVTKDTIGQTVQAVVAFLAQKMGVKPGGMPPQPGAQSGNVAGLQDGAGGQIPGGVSPSVRQQGMGAPAGGGLIAGNMGG